MNWNLLGYKLCLKDRNYPPLPDKDTDKIDVVLEIRHKFKPKVESYQQLIQELENPELLTPLEQAEKKHKINRLEIEALKPLLKPRVFDIVENYRENMDDIAGIEVLVMDTMWKGKPEEHIKGANNLEELKNNRKLVNYVIERVINQLGNNKSLIEWEIANLWIKNHRRTKN